MAEIDAWAGRLVDLARAADVFAYFDDDGEAFAVRNAWAMRSATASRSAASA